MGARPSWLQRASKIIRVSVWDCLTNSMRCWDTFACLRFVEGKYVMRSTFRVLIFT